MSFAVESSGGCNGGVNVLRVGVQTLEMLDRLFHAKGRMFYPFADQSALNKLGLCNLSLTLPERFVSLEILRTLGAKPLCFTQPARLVVRSAQCCVPQCFGRRYYCLPSQLAKLLRRARSSPHASVFSSPRCLKASGIRNQSVNPAARGMEQLARTPSSGQMYHEFQKY